MILKQTVHDAIKHMILKSDITQYDASIKMGRARSFISQLISKQSMPRVTTMIKIANVCGYHVILWSPNDIVELVADDIKNSEPR